MSPANRNRLHLNVLGNTPEAPFDNGVIFNLSMDK